jgi:SNF2 family DNA or RNA helicase
MTNRETVRREYIPRPYQRLMIAHALRNPRCALWAGMGTGKTSATLFALDFVRRVYGQSPALVIAPLRVAQSTWPDEAKKWAGLEDLSVSVIVGSAKQRRAALLAKASVYTINFENIPWLIEELGRLGCTWPFRVIVVDESTRLKSFRTRSGSMRARALAKVAYTHVDRFIELTGTPSPNGLADLWGQSWFLDRGERLCPSFSRFTYRWFREIRIGSDAFATKLEPRPGAAEDIQAALSDICLAIRAEDWFDIDEPIVRDVPVELPAPARKVYGDMQQAMFAELESGTAVEAFSAGAVTTKCLQVASGALYTDDSGAWEEIHDGKIAALRSIVEESAGAPVLVAYHWKHDLDRLLKAFPEGRALDRDPQTIRDWNAGKIPVLFAHPASAGHGLNMQDGGSTIVFFSHWWDLEQRQQIVERIGPTRQTQAGHPRPVYVYNIVAKDTLDEVVIQRCAGKQSVQDALLDYMRRTKA